MGERVRDILLAVLTNLKRSGWASLASIATISVSFIIIGIFLLLTLHLSALVAMWKAEFQVVVFLEDGITQEQLSLLRKRILNEAAVKALSYLSKEEALASFKRELRGNEGLLEGLGENPLPASFQLKIHEKAQTPQVLKQLAAYLGRLEGVEDVLYGQEWVEKLSAAVQVLKVLGIGIGAVLAFGSLLIVSNAVRLAVYARAEEIEIMRLVGATRAYIGVPFLIEGLLQGACGALIALAFILATQEFTLKQLGLSTAHFLAGALFLPPWMPVGMVGAGAFIGAFGSFIVTSRFLKL